MNIEIYVFVCNTVMRCIMKVTKKLIFFLLVFKQFWFEIWPRHVLTSFMRFTQYCGKFVSNTSELANHHKSISKIRHFTLFILIYSTLLYGCCVCIYCMSDLTYVWIYTLWRHKAEQVMSLCNKYYTHVHTQENWTQMA